MIFKERHYQCLLCPQRDRKLAWDYDPAPVCDGHGPMFETGHILAASRNRGVIDDQLEGGPRRFETMGHDAPYIETKSQWRREVEKRGLVNVVKHDDHYYRTRRKWHDEEKRDTGRNLDY